MARVSECGAGGIVAIAKAEARRQDAESLLIAAARALGDSATAPVSQEEISTPATTQIASENQPTSFASGFNQLRRFLSEGVKEIITSQPSGSTPVEASRSRPAPFIPSIRSTAGWSSSWRPARTPIPTVLQTETGPGGVGRADCYLFPELARLLGSGSHCLWK